jgi:hypothetical protein
MLECLVSAIDAPDLSVKIVEIRPGAPMPIVLASLVGMGWTK